MAYRVAAGDLRTRITVFDKAGGNERDKDGYRVKKMVNVFGEGGTRKCRWVNAHGSEVYTARQAGVREPATLTVRYTPKITPTCLVYRDGDPRPYEVISLNDVENRHIWLELKVQRKVASH